MFVRVWRYRVDAAHFAEFARAYAADGDWARLFARSAGYVGTELYRSHAEAGMWITVDSWAAEADWHAFLDTWADDYHALDRTFEALTLDESEIAATATENPSQG